MAVGHVFTWSVSLSLTFTLLVILAKWHSVYARYNDIFTSRTQMKKGGMYLHKELMTDETNAYTMASINVSYGRRKFKFKYIGGNMLYYPNSVKTFRLILICGDVETNPGQSGEKKSQWKFPCAECSKPVKNNQNGILCVVCSLWYHAKCAGISKAIFSSYYVQHPDVDWSCINCSICRPSDSFFEEIEGEGKYGNLHGTPY